MLLLHGFTGSSRSWPPGVVDGLTSAGWRPVLVDLPGHGRHVGDVDPGRFALETVFEDLGRASGPDPCPVVGYSMGGRIALAYAVGHPDRVSHLVLESASPGLPTEAERARRREADDALATRIESEGVEAFIGEWEMLPLFESQRALAADARDAQRARRRVNDPRSLAAALRRLGTGALPSYWEALEALDLPVLLITGALDRKFTSIAEEMTDLLRRGHAVVVEGAGHAVHLERPDAWIGTVLPFLAERRASHTGRPI
jgi:2-succinyl-6-hydroxy-2,4-cyclohexadiene-1-carboxylate synthase